MPPLSQEDEFLATHTNYEALVEELHAKYPGVPKARIKEMAEQIPPRKGRYAETPRFRSDATLEANKWEYRDYFVTNDKAVALRRAVAAASDSLSQEHPPSC
jgi:hypothetical protein